MPAKSIIASRARSWRRWSSIPTCAHRFRPAQKSRWKSKQRSKPKASASWGNAACEFYKLKLTIRHNKHPAEREQHFALIVGPVGFLKAFQAQLFKELALLGIG